MALSYHSWLDMAAVLFFLLLTLYSVTYRERVSTEEEAYDETGLKRKVYLLSERAE